MFSGDIAQPRYPNPNYVVYPNNIPYQGSIPSGLHDGKLIEIKGHVPYGADVFSINLLSGLDPNSDRPLHISVRFHNRTVIRNTLEHNSWGSEEKHGLFPFATGRDFTLLILVTSGAYRIAVNSQHCWEFPHRIHFSRVSSIFIDGSVKVERIEFIDKVTPGIQPGVCIPAQPSVCPAVPSSFGIQPAVCPAVPSSFGIQPAVCPAVPPSFGIQPAVCPPVPSSFVEGYNTISPPENRIGIRPGGGIQSNTNLAPVYNPSIPYAYPIYGGLKPGMMIYISGRPSANPDKFTINLQSGTSPYPPPDIAFHFDVRFYNFTVVRNSRSNSAWNTEETLISHFPYQPAVNFDMIIKVEHDKYMIAFNGQHFLEFRHRLTPLSRFDTLYIEKDVIISSIRFA